MERESWTADLIPREISTRDPASELRGRAQEARRLARDLREPAERTGELALLARDRLRPAPRPSFIPLVVEGDAEVAGRRVQALKKADVVAALPVLRGRDEAIRCLDELSRPDTHVLRAVPSILLVDSELPEEGAMAILKHVRALPGLARLPVILRGPPGERSRLSRAVETGANSYVERPADFEALVNCLKILKTYWGSLNHGPGAF